MKKNGVYETVHELIHAVKKLRTNQPLKWLNVPTINAFKRRNVKGLLRATVVWQWGEALLQHHPQVQARHTYYYAQIWPDNKPIKKYFFYGPWHAECSNEKERSGTGYLRQISETIIRRYDKKIVDYGKAELEKKLLDFEEYFSAIQQRFEHTIPAADLRSAEAEFKEQSLRTLRIRELGDA